MAHAIAATGRLTTVGACVGIRCITIIAGLAVIDASIAAALDQALIRATVAELCIGVITFFKIGVFGLDVTAVDPIAADRQFTHRSAGVLRVGITVITSLLPRPDHTIAATCRCASTQTCIDILGVAIIALLTLLQNAIAARRWLTRVAVIRRVIVAIITALTRTYNTVAAAC